LNGLTFLLVSRIVERSLSDGWMMAPTVAFGMGRGVDDLVDSRTGGFTKNHLQDSAEVFSGQVVFVGRGERTGCWCKSTLSCLARTAETASITCFLAAKKNVLVVVR